MFYPRSSQSTGSVIQGNIGSETLIHLFNHGLTKHLKKFLLICITKSMLMSFPRQLVIYSMLVLLLPLQAVSQNMNNDKMAQPKKNEMRVNLFSGLLGLPELNYERLLNENSGLGLAISVAAENKELMATRALVLPYYRMYFGKKYASGFFIEGNMGFSFEQQPNYNWSVWPRPPVQYNSGVYYGLGSAIGVKLENRNRLIGEVFLGGGRLFGDSYDGGYLRIGVCLGGRW
jgi:hypothetical protein